MDNSEQITYFADTDARNKRVRFGIKQSDRTRHVYVIGKTGMGKSTLLENMAVQDIRHGNGFAFMDPHGKTADLLLEYIPKERIDDVIYFAPFDMEHPISFNIMEDVGFDKRHLVVSGLMSTFKKIWVDAWSARMEYILGNTLLALLEYPDATLLEVNRMLSDKDFRKKVVDNVTDPSVKSFWVDEFAKYTDRFAAEATPAIQNKIGQFTANPLIRNILGQAKSSFDLREIMDERKILIVNLSKGQIGEQNANLLGSMLITKIYLAALSRADVKEVELQKLPNFYLFVDEFQSFANESFANILSEARKYKLNLTIAHQYIEQMTDEVRAAVFGNVGTLITFRVGSYDAEVLEKEFAPTFTAEDIVNLGAYQIYLRLMIDGIGSSPFSAASMPPLEKPEVDSFDAIRDASRKKYTRGRAETEDLIRKNMGVDESGNKTNGNGAAGGNKGNGGNGAAAGENSGGNRGGNRVDKKSSGERVRTSGQGSPKKRPMIDEKTKAELEKALQENAGDDLKEISLADMTKKTSGKRNGNSSGNKNEKGASEDKTNDLKSALADVLKVVPAATKSSEAPKKESTTAPEKNSSSDPVSAASSSKEPAQNNNQNLNKNQNPNPRPQRDQAPSPQREIPEKELKDVLGL
jgi:hypothetical protein